MTTKRISEAWLAIVSGVAVVVGLSLTLDVAPTSAVVARLRAPAMVFDLAVLPSPTGRLPVWFGLFLIAWAVLILGAVFMNRRRWIVGLAAVAGGGACWLVREAGPFWTELATVIAAFSFLAVALPAVLLAATTQNGRSAR